MKKELKILLYADIMFMLAGGLFGPLYAVFVESIGGDLATAGVTFSLYCIVTGILIFLMGKFEDRFKNQEELIVLGYFISCLGFLGYLFISNTFHLYVVQVVLGAGVAIRIPVYRGVYSNNLDKGKFASQWGLWDSLSYFFWGISSFIGGFIAKFYGFRVLFIVMLALSIIGLLVSVRLLFIRKRKENDV